jgi:hypothetical protein
MAISVFTRKQMSDAVSSAAAYSRGRRRKELQAAYDKFLDELSQDFFGEPCSGRMEFRQKMNAIETTGLVGKKQKAIRAIRQMLANEQMLFNKDYRDVSDNVAKFLVDHVQHVLEATSSD